MISKQLFMGSLTLIFFLSFLSCISTPDRIAEREYNVALLQWEQSLEEPMVIFKGWRGEEKQYGYQCPPDYHLINCPRCSGEVVGSSRLSSAPVLRIDEYKCPRCKGMTKLCEFDCEMLPIRP